MAFQLSSSAFQPGQPIPARYAEDGEDLSPPLAWTDPPAHTVELALLCDDPDAPTPKPWVHWIVYKLPAELRSLAEAPGAKRSSALPEMAQQGENSWPSGRTIGYRGPAPPPGHGVHHYHFQLYALSRPVALPPGATKEELLAAMDGHILAAAELIGTYVRERASA